MGKAKMEEGDRDMGKSQTVEGSIGGGGIWKGGKKGKKKMVMVEEGVKMRRGRVDRIRRGGGGKRRHGHNIMPSHCIQLKGINLE